VKRPRRWHAAGLRWRHSIRWRLVTLFVLLALATSAVFVFGMQRMLRTGWEGWARTLVADYVDRLAGEIGDPPQLDRAQAIVQRLPVSVRIEGPQVNFDSRPAQRSESRHDREHAFAAWGLVRLTGDGHRITFGLAALPDLDRGRRFGWLTLCALLLQTAVAYVVVHRLLAPLAAIGAGAARFGSGRFDEPIVVPRRDELGALAERVNGMAASLQAMLDAKRSLLLAISHELRSPLTRARLNAELIDDGEPRTALLRDLAEMRDLIDALLESERIAAGHQALHIVPLDLPALVRDTVAAMPQAATVAIEIDGMVEVVDADPVRLKLLLRNLIDNALRHGGNEAGTPPVVFLRREADGRLALGVRDHGAGVSAEQLAHLAEAFYRPDTARTRSTGGVGLGLYLCRLVALAHGGELRLRDAGPGLEAAMVWRSAKAA
jgi:signal transduction histidine kinase